MPSLAFYRRGRRLEDLLSQIVASENFPQRELTTLKTIARHLTSLRQDDEVVAAAERLEKAAALFEELRDVLRLSSASDPHLLRGRAIRNDRRFAEGLKIVVARTNNPAEHRFARTKQAVRRKVGAKKLTRYVQAMRPEELLVANLSDPQYLEIVCAGTLSNLAAGFADHWSQAQANRVQRQKPKRDHPMPTSKKQLRNPEFLNTVKQTINAIVQALAGKPDAA